MAVAVDVVVGYIGYRGYIVFIVPAGTPSSLWLLKVGRETAWVLLSWAPLSAVSPLLASTISEQAASARFPSIRVTTHVPKEAVATAVLAGLRLLFLMAVAVAVVVGYIGHRGFIVPAGTSSSLWLLKVGRETAWVLFSWVPLVSAVSPLLASAASEQAASPRFQSIRVTTLVPKEAVATAAVLAGLRLLFLMAVAVAVAVVVGSIGSIGHRGYSGFLVPAGTSSSLWLLKVGRETASTSLGVLFKDCHAPGFVENWTLGAKGFTGMMVVFLESQCRLKR
jgi:hypothetical protein